MGEVAGREAVAARGIGHYELRHKRCVGGHAVTGLAAIVAVVDFAHVGVAERNLQLTRIDGDGIEAVGMAEPGAQGRPRDERLALQAVVADQSAGIGQGEVADVLIGLRRAGAAAGGAADRQCFTRNEAAVGIATETAQSHRTGYISAAVVDPAGRDAEGTRRDGKLVDSVGGIRKVWQYVVAGLELSSHAAVAQGDRRHMSDAHVLSTQHYTALAQALPCCQIAQDDRSVGGTVVDFGAGQGQLPGRHL